MLAVKETYQVVDGLKVHVEVLNNPYGFELNQLFQMATRINKKRSFLFVSKVLGKHLAVNPKIPLLVGYLLSMRYNEIVFGQKDDRAKEVAKAIQTKRNIDEVLLSLENKQLNLTAPTTFIGFAETATALGHAVFSSFQENGRYIHTTREHVNEVHSVIDFEEEHSHATSHRVYAKDSSFFNDKSDVVLVDDEVTTGKTAINIIRTIKNEYPQKESFTVISILDWRTPEHRERYHQLEKELNITIHVVSLIDGIVTVTGEPKLKNESTINVSEVSSVVSHIKLQNFTPEMYEIVTSTNVDGMINNSPYLKATGRFGLDNEGQKKFSCEFEALGKKLMEMRKGKKTLIIGTGEFMYVPMKVATYMGSDVYLQSTTRSPIYQSDEFGYTIKNKFVFDSPENSGVTNHLYNIEAEQYDEIFIFVERVSSLSALDELINELRKTCVPVIQIVTMNKIVDEKGV